MSLPDGFRVRLAPRVRTVDQGRLLVGGSPLTAMRLSPRALALLAPQSVTVEDADSRHLAERLLATNLGLPDLDGVDPVPVAELTVIIPVRDRPEQLDQALGALAPLRCVVVDDASHAPAEVARVAARHGAQLVALTTNVGPAGARNAGLATVTTPYVAFVDSDVTVSAADLLRLTRHFADPAVALVGPRVGAVSRSARPRWFERYDAAASSLALGRTPGVVRPGAAVAWLPSACLVARAETLSEETCGFDETMRVGEDVDLVWRLVGAGHRVRYDPAVEAAHDARPTIRGWLGRKLVYGSGGAGLAARHGDRLAPAVLTPSYAAAGAALLLRRRWSLPLALALAAPGARGLARRLPAAVAARTAAQGLGWAVRQESALLLRHWWPLTALGLVGSRSVRRALGTALLVDLAVALAEHRDDPLDLPTLIAGRRLDDLAYGSGLWWGALRARSPRVLLPRRP
ncbi:mycofactocin biosynthesis glycosyltransferase MftF [Nocardioides sp. cx-173]|uniref:mycofactocin biosynthesis glycosyltransferase MftF n=1 Tax=Nocardioides sp. cx-173 TaxID=2898796 RepID=UPI001E595CDA|nr:mycofactocin biosynthesis glycosyltransferase MftF [Nocardioides sp. cx-173]MCD4523586.1 mycofactocin biosynthesis glycosyltransferase MftF [Nocardioides sp. cx-173]UGB42078.1 mycofactocin biosynthesis glycosyltransferase MftF [Nocardioides sp. cx-173]